MEALLDSSNAGLLHISNGKVAFSNSIAREWLHIGDGSSLEDLAFDSERSKSLFFTNLLRLKECDEDIRFDISLKKNQWSQSFACSMGGGKEPHGATIVLVPRNPQEIEEECKLKSWIVDQVQHPIVVASPAERIVLWNKVASTQFGWNAGEMKGKDFNTIFSSHSIAPESRKDEGECSIQTKDGQTYRLWRTSTPIMNSAGNLVGTAHLLADCLQKSVDLSNPLGGEFDLLLSFLQQMRGAVAVLDSNKEIVWANNFFYELFGFSSGEIQGKQLENLITIQRTESSNLEVEKLLKEDTVQGDFTTYKKDGTAISLGLCIFPLHRAGGNQRYYAAHLQPCSLKRVADAAIQRAEKEKTANREKTDYITTISHELRTPLNGIIGVVSLMLGSTIDTEELQENLEIIYSCSQMLLMLINNVIDLEKLESGKLDNTQMLPSRVKTVIEQSIKSCSAIAKRRSITIKSNVEHDVPEYIVWNSTRVMQVLVNLVGNAVKFSPDDSEVQVCVKLQSIAQESMTLLFIVRDFGCGIAPEKITELFGQFVQLSNFKATGGSGLGLHISKRLVESMDGRIWVESELGEGSTFFFTIVCGIPRQEQIQQLDAELPPRGRHSFDATFYPLDLMIAEDNPVNQTVLKKILMKRGFQADTAENGQEAINLLQKKHYDLIFMDAEMPVMDGLKATAHIVQHWKGDDRPTIIGTTAHAMKHELQACLDAGMDDVVSKPIPAKKINSLLDQFLQQKYRKQPNREEPEAKRMRLV